MNAFNCSGLLAALLVLASCVGMPTKKTTEGTPKRRGVIVVHPKYLLGELPESVTASEIYEKLKVKSNDARGGYEISANIWTAPYAIAQLRESGKKQMESPKKIRRSISSELRRIRKKTCFTFLLEGEKLEDALFRNYRVKIELPNGKLREMKFEGAGKFEGMPERSHGYYDWNKITGACTSPALNLAAGVKMHILPKASYKANKTLVWEVLSDTQKPVGGKKNTAAR